MELDGAAGAAMDGVSAADTAVPGAAAAGTAISGASAADTAVSGAAAGAALPPCVWGMHTSYWTHVAMLAADIHRSPITPGMDALALVHGHPVFRVLVCGVVVRADRKGYNDCIALDDGTGVLECVLWTQPPRPFALGELVEVCGRLRPAYRSHWQAPREINVDSARVLSDPNAEALHWLQCLRAARVLQRQPRPSPAECLQRLHEHAAQEMLRVLTARKSGRWRVAELAAHAEVIELCSSAALSAGEAPEGGLKRWLQHSLAALGEQGLVAVDADAADGPAMRLTPPVLALITHVQEAVKAACSLAARQRAESTLLAASLARTWLCKRKAGEAQGAQLAAGDAELVAQLALEHLHTEGMLYCSNDMRGTYKPV